MKHLLLILIAMSSNLGDLDGMILRDTTNPPLTDKGSALTYGEFDGNFVKQYNAIQDIVSGENVTAYDAGATYDQYSTDVYEQYAGYDGRIWKAVYNGSPSSFSGQTPAEGVYWTQVSLAQMVPNIMALAQLATEISTRRNSCPAYCAKVTLTAAQVLQLNSTPIQIVAAPGYGKAIDVISVARKLDFNSIAYATNLHLLLYIDTADDWMFEWDANGLGGTNTTIIKGTNNPVTVNSDTQLIENKSVIALVEAGDPTAGDSDITIYVYYHIINL